MKIIIYSLLFLSIISCASVAKYNNQITKTHTVAELQEDIDYAYRMLKNNHPDLDEYYPQEVIDVKFDSLKKAIKPMNTHDFYYTLNEVLKPIAQGHTSIKMPLKKYTRKERKSRGKRTGFSGDYAYKTIGNKLYISRHIKGDSLLPIGTELVKINSENTKDLLDKYRKTVISDGYNQTFQNRIIGKRFWSFYTYDHGIVDSVRLECIYNDSVFTHTLKAKYKKKGSKKASEKTITKSSKDSIKDKAQDKVVRKALRKKHKLYEYDENEKVYYRDFKFIRKDSSKNPIAYLKIRGFRAGKYKKSYDAIFRRIDSSKAKVMILDLRDNFGGSLADISYLFSYLATDDFNMVKPAKVKKRTSMLNMALINTSITTKILALAGSPVFAYMMLHKIHKDKDGNLYYTYKFSKTTNPKSKRFKGKLYVLINGNSFSASCVLSTQLQATKRATFVGEETGGAYNSTVAGGFIFPELPHSKITMRFGLMNIKTPYYQNPAGHGIYPDKKILPNLTDLLKGKDTELDWILEQIK